MNVQRVANFINNSPRTQKILRKISDNPALCTAIGATGVSMSLRPATILAITPNKKDGVYGASSSITSAIVEMLASYAMLKPMQKAIDNSSKILYNTKNTIYHQNALLLRRYKSVSSRLFKIPTIAITSLLRFSLVHPTAVLLGKLGIAKGVKNG